MATPGPSLISGFNHEEDPMAQTTDRIFGFDGLRQAKNWRGKVFHRGFTHFDGRGPMTSDTPSIPELTTERLTLRAMRLEDVGLLSLYSSDPRVAHMTTSIPNPNPPEMVEAFVRSTWRADRDETTWAIDASRGYGASVIGAIALRDEGSVGYWVAPFFWGLGLATEALGAVVSHADSHLRGGLSSQVFKGNPASRRVLEKQGFKVTGEGSAFVLSRDTTVPTWQLNRPDPASEARRRALVLIDGGGDG